MRNSGYNSYDSQPTFDDDNYYSSVDSTDTLPTLQDTQPILSPPHLYNQSPSPPHLPYPNSPIHSSTIMSSFTDNDHKTDNKTNILHNNHTAKTQKKQIPLSSIFGNDGTNAPEQLTNRQPIFENVLCGNYQFDIGFYVKNYTALSSDDSPNTLLISITQKSRSRGTKRPASQTNDNNSQANKRRKLNDSRSQSYTIGTNGHSSFNTNDNTNNNDNIQVSFTIKIATSNNDPHPLIKQYTCKFGENNDNDSDVNLNNWTEREDDSDCDRYPQTNAFKIETFDDLTDRFNKYISNLGDDNIDKIPKKQCIYVSCEIQILNINNDNNSISDSELNRSIFSNRIFKRHIFRARQVSKFVGLKNEGATCYMNSMLQTLYHIASLRRNVYKIPVGHEAQQKKKKQELENKKNGISNGINGTNGTNTHDAMDCDDDNNTICTNISDDDDDDVIQQKKRNIKPPISLELQRLFYQLQTGAESNHQDEYQLGHKNNNNNNKKKKSKKKNKKKKHKNKNKSMDNDNDSDGNDSDCSIFTLKSDNDFTGDRDDDDVNMSQQSLIMDDKIDNNSTDMLYWHSSYDKAVSTSNLIKSFGWSGSDAFVQHDVQEFLRVLMDKIETKVKCTHAEKIVDKLFSGEYQSYVSCTNVEYESVRNENFQDIQLTIPKSNRRNNRWSSYGSTDMNKAPDIYDCIRKFIEPEALDGDNQYYANDELKKQDADKGLRFKRFPPVLFLQLCRFEIDHYQHTSKINDPVRFYEDIDLNPFVYVDTKGGDNEESKDDNNMAYNRKKPNLYYNHLPIDCTGNSEFSYQLFSVLVHSGSTYGGHYFAYINPSGNKWYKFDDENVSVVDSDEATKKQFGGSSRQSAYMLVYIQKKYAKQILGEVNENDIPFDLRKYFSAEKEKQRKMRLEEIENSKKCVIEYMNGHDIVYESCSDDIKGGGDDVIGSGSGSGDYYNDIYVNVLDMGKKSLLKSKKIYKDVQFKDIYKNWCEECDIKMEHLMVYNFTERKNKTLRTNREIKLDLNEDNKGDDTDKYSDDDIKRHKIPTKPELKYVKSIYNRIGNIQEKKRMYILFDKNKIEYLAKKNTANSDGKVILMALKYFDIFEQKLYFVDWLLVKTGGITFGDIMKYVESKLIVDTRGKRSYFEVLYNYNNEINEYERKHGKKKADHRYVICEEEATLKNKGTRDEIVCKVNYLGFDDIITDEYFDGDMFVFQLNAYHAYFNTLKPDTKKIDNLKQIMNNKNTNHNNAGKSLSLKIKLIKNEFSEKGIYWYDNVHNFLQSQLNMTCIELKVRENTGWKTRWTAALALQYKNDNKISMDKNIDKEIKKKLFKSKHKWHVEKRITYGMIRKKLGNYYNINPNHIEIWLPQHTYSYSDKWDYGSKGRGKWNGKLETLLSDGRHEWNEQCALKFEIQTYRMQDFDKMTLYDNSNSNSYMMNNRTFSQRITELAMFNFEIIAPNKAASGCGNMTMSFCKNWTAKTLSNGILKDVIENPIFGYTFFSEIVKYIRENEIDENKSDNKYIDDISILKSLSSDRFLICDEENGKLPSQYYMNKQYKMPSHFSQIKYTDFRVQFLAKNDPLVLNKKKYSQQQENDDDENENEIKIDIDDNDNDNDNEMDIDTDDTPKDIICNTKALWFHISKSAYSNRKQLKIRIVIENGQSLKDVIMKYLKPFLKIDYSLISSSKQSSLSIDMKDDKNNKDNDKDDNNDNDDNEEKSNDDIIFDQICKTHQFKLKNTQNGKLKKCALENVELVQQINYSKMFMIITLPITKKKSINSYDKPLKIAD